VWIGILIFTATHSQNWFKLRNFSRNLWLGNHFFHQYLSFSHIFYHLNRTCLFSRDLLKYMWCLYLKVVIEFLLTITSFVKFIPLRTWTLLSLGDSNCLVSIFLYIVSLPVSYCIGLFILFFEPLDCLFE
jgi:hypothetical protein